MKVHITIDVEYAEEDIRALSHKEITEELYNSVWAAMDNTDLLLDYEIEKMTLETK